MGLRESVFVAGLVVMAASVIALALTRRRWPPEKPKWRLWRTIAFIGAITLMGTVGALILGSPATSLDQLLWSDDWFAFAAMVANAVIIGWLVPSVIERRSLREMGWQINFWAIAAIAVVGLAVFADLAQWPHGPQAAVAVFVAAFVSAGFREENLFRGHLMPTLQENAISPLNANLLQAAVFSAGHLPWLVVPVLSWSPADFIIFGWGSLVKWFVWGLLFGWLRMRTRSIIPAVAAHGLFDYILFVGYLSD